MLPSPAWILLIMSKCFLSLCIDLSENIGLLQFGFSVISNVLQAKVSSSALIVILYFGPIVSLFGPALLAHGDLWLVTLSLLDIPWFPTSPRSSIRFRNPLLRLNTALWRLLVVNSNGFIRCLLIFEFLLLVRLLFSLIIKRHFTLLSTPCFKNVLNILK